MDPVKDNHELKKGSHAIAPDTCCSFSSWGKGKFNILYPSSAVLTTTIVTANFQPSLLHVVLIVPDNQGPMLPRIRHEMQVRERRHAANTRNIAVVQKVQMLRGHSSSISNRGRRCQT